MKFFVFAISLLFSERALAVEHIPIKAKEVQELVCLSLNVYFEAGNQSMLGKEAVAEVVLNRVNNNKYPSSICEVIFQGETYKGSSGKLIPKRYRCQFTWYCDGLSDTPKDYKAWIDSMEISRKIIENGSRDITEGSTHYHSTKVDPYWAGSLQKTVRIDDHIFYKEKDWK